MFVIIIKMILHDNVITVDILINISFGTIKVGFIYSL